MMGPGHALSGVAAGLAIAPSLGYASPVQASLIAMTTGGAALFSDADHPKATISTLFGRATGVLSSVLRWMSRSTYAMTATKYDRRCLGEHRYLTHTLLFAVVLGVLIGAGVWAGGAIAAGVVALFSLCLVFAALGGLPALVLLVGSVVALLMDDAGPAAVLADMWLPLGVGATVGCVTHILGDWLTEAPVPMLGPFKVRGRRWYPCNAPAFIRFRAGGVGEKRVVMPLLWVVTGLLVPGVWPLVLSGVDAGVALVV